MVYDLNAMKGVDIEVVGFEPNYAAAFAELNYEWIAKDYAIEEHDREILDSPSEYVIEKGGEIFIALADGRPVGAVALIRLDSDGLELAKMAVSPVYRGLGIGDALISACIEFAGRAGFRLIVLESNTKQAAAIGLYRKFGFTEVPLDPNSPYERVNIRMQLAIA